MCNIFTVFLNCAHQVFEYIKMMQYPDSCLVLVYQSLIYYKSQCDAQEMQQTSVLCEGISFFFFFFLQVCSETQRFHPSWHFLATCHSFTQVEYMYDICYLPASGFLQLRFIAILVFLELPFFILDTEKPLGHILEVCFCTLHVSVHTCTLHKCMFTLRRISHLQSWYR